MLFRLLNKCRYRSKFIYYGLILFSFVVLSKWVSRVSYDSGLHDANVVVGVLRDDGGSGTGWQVNASWSSSKKVSNLKYGQYAEDLMTCELPELLPNYKSSCWFEDKTIAKKTTQELHCLPYVYVLGFPKCGTTDIFVRLNQHPKIAKACAKELHFLSRMRFASIMSPRRNPNPVVDGKRKLSWYTWCIAKNASLLTSTYTTDKDGKKYYDGVTLDGTPSTAWDFTRWPWMKSNAGLKLPKYITPHVIEHLNPNSKFIVLLRHPIKRLFSDYLHFHGFPADVESAARDFHERVVFSLSHTMNCLTENSEAGCFANINFTHLLEYKPGGVRLLSSLYVVFLEEWLKVFPREQFLFIQSETFLADMTGTVTKLLDFLGLEKPSEREWQTMIGMDARNVNKKSIKLQPYIQADTQTLLHNFLRPYNQRLAKLLDNPDYLWKS